MKREKSELRVKRDRIKRDIEYAFYALCAIVGVGEMVAIFYSFCH